MFESPYLSLINSFPSLREVYNFNIVGDIPATTIHFSTFRKNRWTD